jgi:hypothetical protein
MLVLVMVVVSSPSIAPSAAATTTAAAAARAPIGHPCVWCKAVWGERSESEREGPGCRPVSNQ